MITINKIDFVPNKKCDYKHDYVAIYNRVQKRNSLSYKKAMYRELVKTDLFFIVYFVLGVSIANHPFVVQACKEVETAPVTNVLFVWARYHFKSTIITIAGTVQYHILNPSKCTGIFSYKKGASEVFVKAIKTAYESEFMIWLFPDVLYEIPKYNAPSWSIVNGITLKRKSTTRTQNTVQASGLTEGMLTGAHFDRRVYDDIETLDLCKSPEQLRLCYECFEMSKNLGTGLDDEIVIVIGTFFHFQEGPLKKIQKLLGYDNKKVFTLSIKPATENGLIDGTPVFISQDKLNSLKKDSSFYPMQLLKPAPRHTNKLKSSLLQDIDVRDIPSNLYQFMIIDPAGDSRSNGYGAKDSWGVHILGVEPVADAIGTSNIYILDSLIQPMGESAIIYKMAEMYFSNGVILQVGYERLQNITPAWLYHFQNILKTRGVILSTDMNNLVVLKHGNRNKHQRISDALHWPLLNGKIFISRGVPKVFVSRLREEMDKFPFWHDDGLDALSYVYDVLDKFGFHYKVNKQEALSEECFSYQLGGPTAWMGV